MAVNVTSPSAFWRKCFCKYSIQLLWVTIHLLFSATHKMTSAIKWHTLVITLVWIGDFAHMLEICTIPYPPKNVRRIHREFIVQVWVIHTKFVESERQASMSKPSRRWVQALSGFHGKWRQGSLNTQEYCYFSMISGGANVFYLTFAGVSADGVKVIHELKEA